VDIEDSSLARFVSRIAAVSLRVARRPLGKVDRVAPGWCASQRRLPVRSIPLATPLDGLSLSSVPQQDVDKASPLRSLCRMIAPGAAYARGAVRSPPQPALPLLLLMLALAAAPVVRPPAAETAPTGTGLGQARAAAPATAAETAVAPAAPAATVTATPAPTPPASVAPVLEIVVPAGAAEGATLVVNSPDGQQLHVVVPAGAAPGSKMLVHPPPRKVLIIHGVYHSCYRALTERVMVCGCCSAGGGLCDCGASCPCRGTGWQYLGARCSRCHCRHNATARNGTCGAICNGTCGATCTSTSEATGTTSEGKALGTRWW
jgi:hypothetical protein